MPLKSIMINNKCTVILRTPGVAITNIEGRSNGANISFMNFTYSDYMMRRKAEVLKYDKKDTNKKSNYSYLTKNSYYSQKSLKNFIDNKTTDCDNKITCACSGIKGSDTPYYLDRNVPYYPNI